MIVLAWACALAALGFLAIELSNLFEFPLLRPLPTHEPLADAYVAMRDEGANVDAFLTSVLAEGGIAHVVVIDDASSDDTLQQLQRAAARDPRVVVLVAPQNVSGKAEALAWGIAQRPPGAQFVLFLDADVRLEPGCVAALAARAKTLGAAAISAWPRAAVRSVAGLLAAPAVTLFLLQALPMRLARGTDPRVSAGNGQLFLVESRAYVRSGGHAASDDIVEDVALARTLKASGARVTLASAALLAQAATYQRFADACRGFGRSLYYGGGLGGCLFVACWQLAAYILPFALIPFAPVPATLAIVAAVLSRAVAAARMRESIGSVVLYPISALAIVAIATYAAIAGPSGGLRWRGRRLQKRNGGA